MEIRLFGDVEVHAAGRTLAVGTPRQRAVLAALALDARRPVAIETLIDRVWDSAPPIGARNVLYSHLSRIRQTLRVERRHTGYVLDIDPDLVDLHRFRRLVERGCAERDSDALAAALRLWRGTPLAGLPGDWPAQVRASWHRCRVDAVVQWAQLGLERGRGREVVALLSDVVNEYPLVEPLEAWLMRALCREGRAAEAIDRYAAVRQRLADELGTDPGAELRALHQEILRGELPIATRRPAQLPPDLDSFSGRDQELRWLDELPASVVAIDGSAGVGKTTLAVHWAHRVADRFVDGQLYVNLRGFDPGGAPVTPAEALHGFLEALDVPPERIPSSVAAQAGLYRSILADRRALIVLDNARDTDQVRPLLPGAPHCKTVVTSRNRLSGLVVGGGQPLTLGLLSTAEAGELLAGRLGTRRVAAEREAALDIIASCARLPLALAVAAARAAAHPGFALATLAGELRESEARLDAFAGLDASADVRSVFSWSHRQLSAPAAAMFRLLGAHPGPDVTVAAAASLAGDRAGGARRALAELAAANLVVEDAPGRYAMHDLLRAYAAELAGPREASEAVPRVLDHYLHTAHAAAVLLSPHRHPIDALPRRSGVTPEDVTGRAEDWLAAELPVLLAAIRLAASTGLHAHTWQLAWTLTTFLDRRGRWHDWVAVQRTALDAAERGADLAGQAHARRGLALSLTRLGRHADACAHLHHALDLFTTLGDDAGQGHTHQHLAWVYERQGAFRTALQHARHALDLHRAGDHRAGQANTLNALGWLHARLGDHQSAVTHCRQALELFERLDGRMGQAACWDSLGYAHHHLGDHRQAIACYQRALELFRSMAADYHEADTLINLGDTHRAAGADHDAQIAWRRALSILEDLRHPRAAQLRDRLTPSPMIKASL